MIKSLKLTKSGEKNLLTWGVLKFKMIKKNLIYIGSSDTLELINNSNLSHYNVLGYSGTNKRKSKSKYISDKSLNSFKDTFIVNNIYNNIDRKNFQNKLKKKFKFLGLIHKSTQIFETAKIHKTNILFPNVIISSYTKIGAGNIISYGSLIGHDVEIGKFNYVCPSCNILSNVKIGSYCLIGTNVTILPGIIIPSYSAIPAGSVVSKNPEINSIFKHYSKKSSSIV